MSVDLQNVFERAQARTTLREERKNRFTRHDENRAAQLRNTDAQQARIKRNDAQHSAWQGDSRTGGARATSVVLDSETSRLRTAAVADRKPKPSPVPEPSDATVYAIAQQWMSDHPQFFRSPNNGANFKNFMFTQIAAGKLTSWDYESFTVAHDWLEANGYFEKPPAPKRREFAMTSAPKVYTPFLSDAESDNENERSQIEQARRIEKDVERALSLPFDQLRKEVRGGLKAYGTQDVR